MSNQSKTPAPIRVNVFPGGFNWGLYVGQDKDLFAKNGIAVQIQETPNSVSQMTDFAAGKFDIAMTAIDNIVAYVEGQGEAPIGAQPEFFAFMGSDSGFLSLVTAPEIRSVAALAGKTLSVDALTTGYAFVLYDILRRSGLEKNAYALVRAGGMIQRWTSLREGKQDGTLLSAPYNRVAASQGFNDIVKATAVIGPYQGNVGAARHSWARQNRAAVVAYIQAYREAIAWLYEPSNREEAITILHRHLPQMPQQVAEQSYHELLHPQDGFFRDVAIRMDGVACVLDLRSRYATPTKLLQNPEKYCDLSYYETTRRQAR